MNLDRWIRQGLDPAKLEWSTAGALRARGLDLPDDLPDATPVALAPGWWAGDGVVELYFADAPSPAAAAKDWVDDGEWGEIRATSWVHLSCWRLALVPPPDADQDAEPEEFRLGVEKHTVELEPEEPPCAAGHDHEWETPYGVVGGLRESPGVWGHGGGVRQYAVCRWCGTYCITDTWATDPVTGVQGLQSVEYAEPDEASLSWLASLKDDKEES